MNKFSLIANVFGALQKGKTVPNPTGWKYTSIAAGIGIIALSLLHSFGFLVEVNEQMIIDLVLALIVIFVNIATDEKIGVTPKEKLQNNIAATQEQLEKEIKDVEKFEERIEELKEKLETFRNEKEENEPPQKKNHSNDNFLSGGEFYN